MKILAVSGSARRLSTNTALLRAMQAIAPGDIAITVFDDIADLPVFSPDLEGPNLPDSVRLFMQKISDSDGLVISSPEYVRNIPGGLKNAIDWLVSGDQIIGKPIALVHASHRGDDMLTVLRTVLSTLSSNFNEDLFLRLPVMKETPESILEILKIPANRHMAESFLRDFASFCRNQGSQKPDSMAL
ncbi:NADPH-dependent FMN reductase [Sinorhizobium alkalisoli]|uniref:FMN reductase n=1 Tax=Sinorhizobium alkalisoli TaxID=1752398 RepID=A0A1E3VF88_9HYPH|nr:NADPH-dependent FMN reductase [Sinorhizobium alkalisoli]MCG5479306.1 NAD(P)H-dependent oxidoreductase [Sinorhizobium alkalisoli]ODR92260.1 FMN reductase [Sinorhizobium alkalisoli]